MNACEMLVVVVKDRVVYCTHGLVPATAIANSLGIVHCGLPSHPQAIRASLLAPGTVEERVSHTRPLPGAW